jgi:hypothetical protein
LHEPHTHYQELQPPGPCSPPPWCHRHPCSAPPPQQTEPELKLVLKKTQSFTTQVMLTLSVVTPPTKTSSSSSAVTPAIKTPSTPSKMQRASQLFILHYRDRSLLININVGLHARKTLSANSFPISINHNFNQIGFVTFQLSHILKINRFQLHCKDQRIATLYYQSLKVLYSGRCHDQGREGHCS